MNDQTRFCSNCGKPLTDGQAFCGFCGAGIEPPPVKRYDASNMKSQHYTPQSTYNYNTQAYQTAQTASPVKRRTYTAQKFISMGFGIGDLICAFTFLLLGIVYGFISDEYYLSSSYDPYWQEMTYAFDMAASVMYAFAALLFIGAVIAWVMFFVYSKKRREVMAQIALEKQQAQANNWNQM